MSRADRIALWLEEARAARRAVEAGQAARARPRRSPFEDEIQGRRGRQPPGTASGPTRATIAGTTITGGQDEERRRVSFASARSGGGGSGAGGHLGAASRSSSSLIADGSAGAAADGGRGEQGSSAAGRARQLAAGYQPAVVKVVSYARGAARATATGQYVQREDVALETHDGRLLADRDAVAAEVKAWSTDFTRRAESQDVAGVRVRLEGVRDTEEGRATYAAAVGAAFAGHRHAWRPEAQPDGDLEARVVVAMAGPSKQRFRLREERVGEGEGAFVRRRFNPTSEASLRARIEASTGLAGAAVRIDPGAPAHGREGVTHRLGRFIEGGAAIDDRGRSIADAAAVRLAAREWRPALRSQTSRDTMHMILSAKADTDVAALAAAARGFLHDRFADHKFMFGVHTDKAAEGHIHVHAVITVRNENGRKIHPGPETFRAWRQAYAEHAQSQGLKIVATGAHERASSQSYGPRDRAIVQAADRPRPGREARDRAYASDPANRGLIDTARQRVRTAQANPICLPTTDVARRAVSESVAAWQEVVRVDPQNSVARSMFDRVTMAQTVGSILQLIGRRVEQVTKEGQGMAVTAEQMGKDLVAMNEAVSSTSDLLDGETKRQFQERSARYLETLAVRVDLQRLKEQGVEQLSRADVERIAGVDADRLLVRAGEIRLKEEREAAAAQRLADRAVEVDRRDEARGDPGPETQRELQAERAAVRGTEQAAAREVREAEAATEAAQILAAHPGQPLPQALVQTDALAKLRAEQEKVLRELDAEKNEGQAIKGQRQR